MLHFRSCLHFLFDLYSQWFASTDLPLALLAETVRSVLLLSDLFYEETQFQWMLESLEDLQRIHPVEDDILTSLMRVGVAKAVAVIGHCDQVHIALICAFFVLSKSVMSNYKMSKLKLKT
jgi:huntingtin